MHRRQFLKSLGLGALTLALPSLGDIITRGGATYEWNGIAWIPRRRIYPAAIGPFPFGSVRLLDGAGALLSIVPIERVGANDKAFWKADASATPIEAQVERTGMFRRCILDNPPMMEANDTLELTIQL